MSLPFAEADTATTITELVGGILLKLLRKPSGQPFSLLAVEIIAEIIGWLPVQDRVIASCICKDWHAAAYSTPYIWTEITYSPYLFSTPVALTKMLQYSAQCPIFLEVTIDDSNYHTVCLALLASIHRITRLDLNVYHLGRDGQIELTRALSEPAPHLRMFWLEDPFDVLSGLGQDGLELFSNVAPCLRDVILRCNIAIIEPDHHTVFQLARRIMIHQLNEWSNSIVAHAIKLFPNMRQLIVRVDNWREGDTPDRLIELPDSLEAFEVIATDTFLTPGHINDVVRWRQVPRVITEFSTDQATEDAIHNFFRATGHTTVQDARVMDGLSVAPTLYIDWAINAPTQAVSSVSVRMLELEAEELSALIPRTHPSNVQSSLVRERGLLVVSTPLPASLGEAITSLVLNELAFDPEMFPHGLPPFPMLEHLTIWTVPATFHAEGYGNSPFVVSTLYSQLPEPSANLYRYQAGLELEDEPGQTPRLSCPALQRLTIVAGHGEWSLNGARLRLSPDQVCKFIATHLVYDTVQLKKLTFIGTELVLAKPEDFSEMCALSETLECDERYFVWAANIHFRWNMLEVW